TYISTLGSAIESAAEKKLRMVVLDRPNPIGGIIVEGPIADKHLLSFTAWHPLPVRHGMTVGELAKLFNGERKIGAELVVIPCERWRRGDWFDATGLTWINPSPNMRSLTEAALYPGIGLLETTNLSVGRGADTPFELVGAPWIDGQKLASHLNARRVPGVRFVPVSFTPNASVFKNEKCNGVNIVITDRARFQSVLTGIEMAVALHSLFPPDWKVDAYLRLLVNSETLEQLKRGDSASQLINSWTTSLTNFRRARDRVLIYK